MAKHSFPRFIKHRGAKSVAVGKHAKRTTRIHQLKSASRKATGRGTKERGG